jgi:hypothetical protein
LFYGGLNAKELTVKEWVELGKKSYVIKEKLSIFTL